MKYLSKTINFESIEKAKSDKESILKKGYERISVYSDCEVYQKIFCKNINCKIILMLK